MTGYAENMFGIYVRYKMWSFPFHSNFKVSVRLAIQIKIFGIVLKEKYISAKLSKTGIYGGNLAGIAN